MSQDLNSVLIEGVLLDCKEKKDRTGWWMVLGSRGPKAKSQGRTSFRVELPAPIREKLGKPLEEGTRVRVIGRLEKASRIGPYVRTDFLEVKVGTGVRP